jgi:hypothetical protein
MGEWGVKGEGLTDPGGARCGGERAVDGAGAGAGDVALLVLVLRLRDGRVAHALVVAGRPPVAALQHELEHHRVRHGLDELLRDHAVLGRRVLAREQRHQRGLSNTIISAVIEDKPPTAHPGA